jgi:hypothetical protein
MKGKCKYYDQFGKQVCQLGHHCSFDYASGEKECEDYEEEEN